MKEVEVVHLAEPGLRHPTLVEGLPGVGHVGKLAAEHLIAELGATPVCRIYSSHFPPQVLLRDDGIAYLVKNEVHAWRSPDGKHDILLLVGDHQSITNSGHYVLVDRLLDLAQEWGVRRIITLGGVATGKMLEEPRVIGAANGLELVEELSAKGIEFHLNDHGGGIVGASGLLVGMAKLRGIPAACLMGETSGYLVDPRSARVLLSALCRVLDVEVGLGELDRRAEEMGQFVAQIASVEQSQAVRETSDDHRYIG